MPSPFKSLITKFRERRRRSHVGLSRDGGGEWGKDGEATLTQRLKALTLASDMEIDQEDAVEENPYQFGTSKAFPFDFKLPCATKWPGPPYDEHARFAPGSFDSPRPSRNRPKQRGPKRKLSQPDTVQSKTRFAKLPQRKTTPEHSRSKTVSKPTPHYVTAPKRDLPLHLLSLPGEIRNHIYRIVCVSREPLIAQFKPIMLPKKGRDNRNRIVVRRFPREPVLALGSLQLRKEVLSIFYGANRFVIRPTDMVDLQKCSLFFHTELEKWTPKWSMADCIAHIEIRFNVRLPAGGKDTSNWTLRRLSDGKVQVSHHSSVTEFCMCFDAAMMSDYQTWLQGSEDGSKDLISAASDLMAYRADRLNNDPSLVSNGMKFRPIGLKCSKCGKDNLRVLERGL